MNDEREEEERDGNKKRKEEGRHNERWGRRKSKERGERMRENGMGGGE